MDNGKKSTIMAYRKRLRSLTTHLRKYERPTPGGYDGYATSYIGDIHWKKILQEEAEAAELPPFTPRFEIEQFALQEKERELRGESIRNQDLISSSKEIFDHIQEAKGLEECDDLLGYIHLKAMQYSEVNKALALNEKYPKPDENRVRSTYSAEHQAAVAITLRDQSKGFSAGAPLQQSERQLVEIPTVRCASEETRRMARTDTELEELSQIRRMIKEALGMPPLMKSAAKVMEEPWQFVAKSDRPRPQPTKKTKSKWKKNIYPPKSREERIADLRKLAPPLRPEYLETDKLPGEWRPELMIDSFQTLFMEMKEQESEDKKDKDDQDSWWKNFYNNKKCLEWLNSIPDTL